MTISICNMQAIPLKFWFENGILLRILKVHSTKYHRKVWWLYMGFTLTYALSYKNMGVQKEISLMNLHELEKLCYDSSMKLWMISSSYKNTDWQKKKKKLLLPDNKFWCWWYSISIIITETNKFNLQRLLPNFTKCHTIYQKHDKSKLNLNRVQFQ